MFADLLAEGFEPHEVKRLYMHGTEKPDTWVDISETMDIKVWHCNNTPARFPWTKLINGCASGRKRRQRIRSSNTLRRTG
jgi:hypothetical protein